MITSRLLLIVNNSSKRKEKGKKGKKVSSSTQTPETVVQSPQLLAVVSVTSGLLFAFSHTLWSFATIAEVYTLNSLLILIIVLLIFRWRRAIIEAKRQQVDVVSVRESGKASPGLAGATQMSSSSPTRPVAASPDPFLYAAAFFFGLGLGVHHVTVGLLVLPVLAVVTALSGDFGVGFWLGLLLVPAVPVLVFATEGMSFFRSRRLVYAALFGFAGLLIYAYLPLAASTSPIINWGDPRTFERLLWHVTGKQYQVFFSFSLETMARQFGLFIKLLSNEFGPTWFPAAPLLAIVGLTRIFRGDKGLFWFLTLLILGDVVYSLNYEIAEDKGAYYLPAFIAIVVAAGFGAEWVIAKVISARPGWNIASYTAVALIFIVPGAALTSNLPYNIRSRYFIAADYTDNILSTIEPGGMLLTRDWQVYSPMLYFREIEHRRTDVIAIDINQLRRSWYFDYLKRVYPETIEQAEAKVDAFLEDLTHWEHDPDLYQRDVSLNQRINTRFYDMILAFVSNQVKSAPVYVTLDIAANRDDTDAELTKALANNYQIV